MGMSTTWLTAIGLTLDFVGFLFLFLGWSGPSPIVGWDSVGIDHDPDNAKKVLPNRMKKDFCMVLILFGLLLQLIAASSNL